MLKMISVPPPKEDQTFRQWSAPILQEITRRLIQTKRKRPWRAIFEVDGFRPEYIHFYEKLQHLISQIIPKEMDRPTIILNIRGALVPDSAKKAHHISLIGGTGPLSDAAIITELLNNESEDMRDHCNIKLISAPPPRSKDLCRLRRYIQIIKEEIESSTCESYFLVSNTAHLNLSSILQLLGKYAPENAKVIDNVQQIVDYAAAQYENPEESEPSILVLGTSLAAKGQLYTGKLLEYGFSPVLPQSDHTHGCTLLDDFGLGVAQDILQAFINMIKRGEYHLHFLDDRARDLRSKLKKTDIYQKMIKSPPVTIGEALLDFMVDQFVSQYPIDCVIMACTELPLLLRKELPTDLKRDELETYYDLFIAKIRALNFYQQDDPTHRPPLIFDSEALMTQFMHEELQRKIHALEEDSEIVNDYQPPLLFSNQAPTMKNTNPIHKAIRQAKRMVVNL